MGMAVSIPRYTRDTITWTVPRVDVVVQIDLREVFAGLP
jgi:hypothetical protein